MLSIFLLGFLILIQVMLVTTIFNNVHLPKDDPHYKKKIIVRDLTELFILTTLTLVLVYNYLQFLGFKMRKTLTISIIIAGCVFISNIIFNRETLFGNNVNIEHMSNINSNDIEDNRESVFSSVPAAYKLMENDENIFNFANKYSFSLFERSRPMTKVKKSMIETEEMKFNEPRNEPLKLHVVFKKDYEEPAGEEGEEAVEEAFDESYN